MFSEALLNLERKLKEERRKILLQEEKLWMQKSHIDWLKWEDGNTKFFHTSTLVRIRRNRTEPLRDCNEELIEDNQELKNIAMDLYADLFKTDPAAGGDYIRGKFLPMSEEFRTGLEAAYSIERNTKSSAWDGVIKSTRSKGVPTHLL